MSTAPIATSDRVREEQSIGSPSARIVPLTPRLRPAANPGRDITLQPTEPATSMELALAATEREVRGIARSIAQAAIEVLGGTRPVQQMSRALNQECYASLQHRALLTRSWSTGKGRPALKLHRNPHVRSVRVCAISDTICEATLVVSEELRSRAVAMRLEREGKVWRVTAMEIG